jgi:hypothetical protein
MSNQGEESPGKMTVHGYVASVSEKETDLNSISGLARIFHPLLLRHRNLRCDFVAYHDSILNM